MEKIQHRLNRLQGQLVSLNKAIEEGEDCEKIIPQFLAIKGALDASFEVYIHASLDTCSKKDNKQVKHLLTILTRK